MLLLVIVLAPAAVLWCGWRDVKRLRKLRGDDWLTSFLGSGSR